MPQSGHVFLVSMMRARRPFRHGSRIGPGSWRILELGAVGDRPVLLQVDVLLDDLGHPQIAERPGGGLDRLGRRVFP